MTDLKRKRSSNDVESTQTAFSAKTPYFDGMPDGLVELADVKLLVQGHDFPVHSYILRESPILLAAVSAAYSDNQRVCQVPLPTESQQQVLLALKHMYNDDTALSIPDAQVLAKFAHKYNMTRLHKRSEAYLLEQLQFTTKNVFGWASLAEHLEMSLLLAHCEQYIILNFHVMAAAEKQVSSISRSSLLRIMDGLAGRDVSDIVLSKSYGGAKLCRRGLQGTCGTLFVGPECPRSAINTCDSYTQISAKLIHQSAVREVLRAMVPSVDLLLEWQGDLRTAGQQ
ncbi:BTB/POZ domain-containing protein 17 [Trebouxia sp. C0010 RCD-2024]